MLASDILNDLNGIIGKNRLSQQVLDDLNRTITHSMLDSNIQSILDNANSSTRSATISGEHNITNESTIFADRNATGNLLVHLPSASANDGRTIRLIPTNNKPIRIESLSGELNGGDWANINQFVEIVSNQGVWFSVDESLNIGVQGKLKDIYPGSGNSSPQNLTDVNGTLFFVANNGTNGQELWKSDGTSAGTTLVKDIYLGSSGSYPYNFFDVNGTLFFSAYDLEGRELWKMDP